MMLLYQLIHRGPANVQWSLAAGPFTRQPKISTNQPTHVRFNNTMTMLYTSVSGVIIQYLCYTQMCQNDCYTQVCQA